MDRNGNYHEITPASLKASPFPAHTTFLLFPKLSFKPLYEDCSSAIE